MQTIVVSRETHPIAFDESRDLGLIQTSPEVWKAVAMRCCVALAGAVAIALIWNN